MNKFDFFRGDIMDKGLKRTKASKILDEEFIKHSIVKWLSAKGWGHF
jgi:hypothetical protein